MGEARVGVRVVRVGVRVNWNGVMGWVVERGLTQLG